MTEANTIRVRLTSTCWAATFTGPMFRPLGMDGMTIPTPFTPQATQFQVVQALYEKNPGARVVIDLGEVR